MYLNCHSYYSLRYGTLCIEDLVQHAKKLGISTLALTDINTTTGVFPFIQECLSADLKPVVGIEFRRENQCLFIALAQNHSGFYEMNQFLSEHNINKIPLPDVAPTFDNVFVIYPLNNAPTVLRPYEYIGVRYTDLNRLRYCSAYPHYHKFVVLHSVTFASQKQYTLHRLLRAIDQNILIAHLHSAQCADQEDYMIDLQKLRYLFRHHPLIIENTQGILNACNFVFDFETPKNKQTYTGSRYSDKLLLERLSNEGLEMRYGKRKGEAKERMIRELSIIDKLNFNAYFLITWDIIRYSRFRGFHYVGRGSGANSIVSYLIGITDVCPMELNLYFERFLNLNRATPPDFDIDWSWRTRDAILEYTFDRFGRECTAFVGTIGMFKHRSTMRELSKVFGLPKEEIDTLSGNPLDQHPQNNVVKAIHDYGAMLSTFPNMRGLHSCGVMITEKPITYYTALDMPPKGFQTMQIDMYISEDIGLEKLDILSQRGLGHIKEAVELVKQNKDIDIDIHALDHIKDNPEANQALLKGQTLGVFYVESPAMRGLLRRLKCDNYKTLVAASSIIRPGVAKSGMMREYIFRHNFPQSFTYPHPIFQEHLSETYGIMVYQEDVIKIAHYFGDLSLADGDTLRRAMSGKKRLRKRMEDIKQRFFKNCHAKGYDQKLIEDVYRQIESFAGYSFCKAHSASYAVESYQSLYLKVYFPLEFMTAVINNQGGFYRKEVYVHEARMSGATIALPCVNTSQYLASINHQTITMGLAHIRGLSLALIDSIIENREEHGLYTSLEDFINRIQIGIESLQNLIFVGAFQMTGKTKNELILRAHLLLRPQKRHEQQKLFDVSTKSFSLPKLSRHPFEDAFDEIELLGFMISHSPFDLLQTKFRGDIFVRDMINHEDKSVRLVGYLIAIKDVPTAKGHMHFGTWIDPLGAYFDTTHFPDCLKAYPFNGPGCYLIRGKIVIEFDFPMLEVEKMAKLPMIPDPRYSDEDDTIAIELPATSDTNPRLLTRKPYPSKDEVDKQFRR